LRSKNPWNASPSCFRPRLGEEKETMRTQHQNRQLRAGRSARRTKLSKRRIKLKMTRIINVSWRPGLTSMPLVCSKQQKKKPIPEAGDGKSVDEFVSGLSLKKSRKPCGPWQLAWAPGRIAGLVGTAGRSPSPPARYAPEPRHMMSLASRGSQYYEGSF